MLSGHFWFRLLALDQRKNYTLGTDSWIENYINEVKPFHTKLREYKLGYVGTDTQDGLFTDFDNPAFYDSEQSKIRPLNVVSDTDKLTEYPWQIWNDYHKKYITSITVSYGGTGYQTTPTVTVLGGTTGSTGPFQIQGTSSRGPQLAHMVITIHYSQVKNKLKSGTRKITVGQVPLQNTVLLT